MRYVSDKTGKTYNTLEEAVEAEKEFDKEQETKSKKLTETSKRKKELSKAIEEANKKVAEANKAYDVAKEQAAQILEEAKLEIKETMEAAEKEVKEAQEDKFNAVRAFNKEFGTYTTTITGEQAAEEFEKAIKKFNSMFHNMFWF